MAKIRFIRTYKRFGCEWMNIIYKSGRLCIIEAKDAPKTAKKFMAQAEKREQYDTIWKCTETIYE